MNNQELRVNPGARVWRLFLILNSIFLILPTFLILPSRALADSATFTPGLSISGGDKPVTFADYFTSIVNVGIIVAISVSVLITIYAGILYSQSQGEASKIALAKELVAGCLTGLAILLLIKLILPTLGITP